jgi:SAM-dependent methyltransferase
MAIVACPSCYGELDFLELGAGIRCKCCGAKYRYAGHVPVIMNDQQQMELSNKLNCYRETTVPRFDTRFRQMLYPKMLTFDPWKKKRMKGWLANFSDESILMDIGAQTFRHRPDIIAFDVVPFPGVDLVGDGLRLPIRSDSVDGIINTGVLEHVESPERMVSEIYRILRPKGEVYVEVPFMQPFHPDPVDFHRFSLPALEKLFHSFEVVAKGVGAGPCSSLNWLLREISASVFENPTLYTYTWILTGWVTFWIPMLDFFLAKRSFSFKTASSYYIIARKPA